MIQQPLDPRARYFDVNGSTPADPEVAELCGRVLLETYGNASAAHPEGRRARAAIDRAREELAAAIGASPGEIWFTSGGTESNNQALFGSAAVSERRHLVVSAVEHRSVLEPARELQQRGYELTVVPPRASGAVHLADLEDAVRPDTLLVSVMWANNETGVVQPVREIAALCRRLGVRFHSDAVCVLGKLPIRVGEVGCDLLSLSSHKLYAPKGCGVLYVREGLELAPLIFGCGQQEGLRSGSENTAGAAGFGRAVTLMERGAFHPATPVEELRRQLWNGIQQRFPGVERNGSGALIPNTLNVHFPGVPAVELQAALAERGFSVAAGASAGTGKPSHVLTAMGLGEERARSSLRFSLGRHSTPAGVAALLDALADSLAACAASVSLEVGTP